MLSTNNAVVEYQIKFWRERLKPTLNKALELTPEDKLNWAPAADMITLGNVFLHIAECSDWWFDEVINGKKCVGLVDKADSPAPAKKDIARHLDTHWQRLERFFACEPAVLTNEYKFTEEGKTHAFTGAWIFTHLLEHDIHHRSQINQYLRILGIKPPRI